MESVVPLIVSGLITGLFTLISKQMELNHATNKSANEAGAAASASSASRLNYGLALRHIGILQLVGNGLGYILGMILPFFTQDFSSILTALQILGTIGLSVGFYWIALPLDKSIRWNHLIIVAIGTAITTFAINSFVLSTVLDVTVPAEALPLAFIQPFISMGIGGFIASLKPQSVVSIPPATVSSSPVQTPPPINQAVVAPAQAAYFLYGCSGEMNGKVMPITRNRLMIGRASSSDLRLREKSVSRTHAQIFVTSSGIYIQDDKSTAGTYINGKKIQPRLNVLLRDGDIIETGIEQRFEFRVNGRAVA